ncbi:uncharacterized protein [Triticum aestivum]|uniref:uncharacterized protein n=1 Tax=Triticum aestivum TaxID=4565 RepID=UPI001D011594|nr:uncharacterized protein LOC123077019 [Triticum aestivum]XP_044355132.1 uncharacterized protein LOC123077019 [Triticum aestivum]XP_044355133.1 uncharacterized protein LOC123077019 [Triticum aestivum]
MDLWSGFIEVIIKAYRCNKSWGGGFSSEDLRMCGHSCRISLNPTFPASFPNLLRDFAKLAHLLISHFKVERKHEAYMRFLYRSMIKPGASETPTPDAQEAHIKFIRNHPALRSLRQKRLFLEDVIKAFRSMGHAEKRRFAKTLQKIKAGPDWRLIAQRNASFSGVLFFRSVKHVFVYRSSQEDLFRFIRNFFAHGSDAEGGEELIGNMEDIDCIDMELMPTFVIQLFHQMIVNSNMSGKFAYAWKHYGLIE